MTTEEITVEDIKALYKQLKHKKAFKEALAAKLNREVTTIEVHWFGGYWRVPKDLQAQVYAELEEAIAKQKAA